MQYSALETFTTRQMQMTDERNGKGFSGKWLSNYWKYAGGAQRKAVRFSSPYRARIVRDYNITCTMIPFSPFSPFCDPLWLLVTFCVSDQHCLTGGFPGRFPW